MPDSTTPIIVPADVRAKFGELVDLIVASESMNDDERRYWIDILPVMNDDQVSKLRDILARERDQLAAIDAKYAKDMTQIADAQSVKAIGEERKQRHQTRAAGEAEVRAKEEQTAEGLLDEMNNV
jgi:hypothetical protein